MKFSEIQLHPILQANLDKIGFVDCTQIQDQAIPVLRKGRDVAGLAQTGTGKTGAFLIPLIDRILKATHADTALAESETVAFNEWKKRQYVLILVPTRELAEQVYENAKKFLENTGMNCVSIYGGTSYDKQVAGLKAGAEFVIATPGRLIDLHKEHMADLGLVRAIVFDEADRMFDMGFKDDMKFILRRVPRDRQFLVFSATLNFDVLNVAYEFGADPVEVNISRDQAKADNVKDFILHVGHTDKPQFLLSILKKHEPKQAIIFSNFKHNVEKIARFLNDNGVPAVGISSLLTQAQRNRVMEQFKGDNDRNILVATDVAARGLDILGVDLVANYELPDDAENYVHRIGRTGRAGATGQAFSLVCDRDVDALQRIEEYLKHKVEAIWLEDSEMVADVKPFPRDDDRGGRFNKRPFSRDGGGGRGDNRDRGGGGGRGGDRGGRGGPRREGGGRGGPPRRDRDHQRVDRESQTDFGVTGSAPGENQQAPRDQGHQHRDRHRGRHEGRRHEGPRSDQPRGEGRRDHQGGQQRDNRGPRHEGRRDHQGGQRDHRGPRDQQGRHQGGRHQGGGHGQRHHGQRHHKGARRPHGAPAPVAAQGLGAKVTGFFKKLFGG